MKWYLVQLAKLISTIGRNWFYILMSIIMPLTLYKIGQGVELLKTMFEIDYKWNMFFILLAFYLLFYALWVVNPYSIKILNLINIFVGEKSLTKENEIELYRRALIDANNFDKQIPVRHFANLPLVIFHCLIVSWYFYKQVPHFLVFILWILGYFVIFQLTYKVYIHIHKLIAFNYYFKTSPVWTGYIFMLILVFITSSIWILGRVGHFIDLFLIAFLIIVNNSLHHYIEHRETPNFNAVFYGNRVRFAIGFFTVIGLLLFFYVCSITNTIHMISPIAIMTVIITFYLLIFDGLLTTPSFMAELIYTNPHKISILKIGSLICSFFFIYSYISNPFSKHDVRLGKEITAVVNRDSMSVYYQNWRIHNKISQTDTIFLVSGQGGGSRAAAWTYLNLKKLSSKKIFAMSTVSGSSSGANSFIFKKYIDLKSGTVNTDPGLCKKLYEYNYLSQSLWGMLIKDGLLNYIFRQPDRNYYHQEDENITFRKTYVGERKDLNLENTIESAQQEDFIEKWYGNEAYELPLLFTNATTSQSGKRTICSPVLFEPKLFCTAIDFYSSYHTVYPINSLMSSTCVNISQSFPFTSASTYLPTIANLIDGGMYENTGSNTLHDIYSYLKALDKDQVFKIISINTSNEDVENSQETRSEIFNTVSSAVTTPFSGHSYYWMKKLELDATSNGDGYEEIGLHKSLQKNEEVALAIYLSKETMNTIYRAAGF